jgi:hypothetical protein
MSSGSVSGRLDDTAFRLREVVELDVRALRVVRLVALFLLGPAGAGLAAERHGVGLIVSRALGEVAVRRAVEDEVARRDEEAGPHEDDGGGLDAVLRPRVVVELGVAANRVDDARGDEAQEDPEHVSLVQLQLLVEALVLRQLRDHEDDCQPDGQRVREKVVKVLRGAVGRTAARRMRLESKRGLLWLSGLRPATPGPPGGAARRTVV